MSGFHPFGINNNVKRNVMQFVADDYWSESNPNIYAAYPRLSVVEYGNNTVASTYWLRDASFLKLKNAEIGYTYKKMRFYISGSNLLTFSKSYEILHTYSIPDFICRIPVSGVQLSGRSPR